MRILYGVTGEGMGHATRSSVVIEHLIQNHDVQIAASGRAVNYLRAKFPHIFVHEITGLKVDYDKNQLRKAKTFWLNIKRLPSFLSNLGIMTTIERSFNPQFVVSDFDSFSYYYGFMHDIPIVCVDNIQTMASCKNDIKIPEEEEAHYKLVRAFVKRKLPNCSYYMIPTFFFPELKKKRTRLFPPVIRKEIEEAEVKNNNHILVYQTADNTEELLPLLNSVNETFHLYGSKLEPQTVKNVYVMPFSEDSFVKDLATCKAVITGGGFSLMSEAVYLGKPILSFPIRQQPEQLLNALYLEKLGYGMYCNKYSEKKINKFVANIPYYSKNLESFPRKNPNKKLLRHLDKLIKKLTS